MRTQHKLVAACALTVVAGAAAFGGSVIAADSATQLTVAPVATLMPGQAAPGDAPGVKAIRRGKAIPPGYRIVGMFVTNVRGIPRAAAALSFQCPESKLLRTFITTGNVGFISTAAYVGHRQTWIRTGPANKAKTTTGTVFAVCR